MSPRHYAYGLVLFLGIAGAAILQVGQGRIAALETALAARRQRPAESTGATPPAAPSEVRHPAPSTAPVAPRAAAPTAPAPRPRPAPTIAFTPLLRVPAATWAFRGGETPLGCFESTLWAAVNGDTPRLGSLLTCDAPAQQALAAAFPLLPEATRSAYGTPEHMLATLVSVQIPTDVVAFAVLGERPVGPDETVIVMRLERSRTSQSVRGEEAYFVFRREAGSWRLVVPSPIVGEMVRHAAGDLPPRPSP